MRLTRLENPFSERVYLVTRCSEKQFHKLIFKVDPHYKLWVEGEASGRMEEPETGGVKCFYIWIDPSADKKEKRGTVVHECLHLVTALFHHCGIPVSYENDEAMAYMLDYLTEPVFKTLRL